MIKTLGHSALKPIVSNCFASYGSKMVCSDVSALLRPSSARVRLLWQQDAERSQDNWKMGKHKYRNVFSNRGNGASAGFLLRKAALLWTRTSRAGVYGTRSYVLCATSRTGNVANITWHQYLEGVEKVLSVWNHSSSFTNSQSGAAHHHRKGDDTPCS